MQPDWRIVSYAVVLTVIAALTAGVLPAWQSVRESIAPDLGRGTRLRLRKTLVVAQVAGSAIVVATAFLFVRNLIASNGMSPGFDSARTLHAEINLPVATYGSSDAINAYVDRALLAVRSVPGVESAAMARVMPFIDGNTYGGSATLSDRAEKLHLRFHWNAVTPDYFHAMDIPVLQGRAFSDADRGQLPVAIVNRSFVSK